MNECIFDKIITGEIPAEIVWESERVLAFYDINPQAPVHVLIIPKKHIESLNSAQPDDSEILGELMLSVKEVARELKVRQDGYRIIINNGKSAGQLVPHIHLHLLAGKDLGPKII